MVLNIQKNLNRIASLLKVKLDSPKTKIPNSGVTSKIYKLVDSTTLAPQNHLEKLEIQQWIEYVTVYAVHVDSSQNAKIILKELNNILATKTYLVCQRLTIADLLLFDVLKSLMGSLTYSEKESYVNVCRWFDNVQYDDLLRSNTQAIDFSSNYLAMIVPAKH